MVDNEVIIYLKANTLVAGTDQYPKSYSYCMITIQWSSLIALLERNSTDHGCAGLFTAPVCKRNNKKMIIIRVTEAEAEQSF